MNVMNDLSINFQIFVRKYSMELTMENEPELVNKSTQLTSRPESREHSQYDKASFQPLDFRQSQEDIENVSVIKIASTNTHSPSESIIELPEKPNFEAHTEEPKSAQAYSQNSSTIHEKVNSTTSTEIKNALSIPEVNVSTVKYT